MMLHYVDFDCSPLSIQDRMNNWCSCILYILSFTFLKLVGFSIPFFSVVFTDVNTAFQQAARNVLIEDETVLQRFRLTIKIVAAGPTPKLGERSVWFSHLNKI